MASGSQNWPDYSMYTTSEWGYPLFEGGCWNSWGAATNIVVGTNPPYSITDFYGFYPKWAGPIAAPINGTLSQGSALVTNINASGLAIGQYVAVIMPSPPIPSGTTITQINVQNTTVGEITLSNPSGAVGVFPFTVYTGPPLVPVQVINAYIALASASLVQARWQDTWPYAMALYCAHFLSLYLRSEGNCSSSCGQAAVAGLKSGITVGMSAGGVSQTLKAVPGIDAWGHWAESSYGSMLVGFAASIGAGPMWVY